MKRFRFSCWGLRCQLIILILLIFIPVSAILVYTGYSQRRHNLADIENNALRLIQIFAEEQVRITDQTRQFLAVLSHVPAVRNLELDKCNEFLRNIHKENPQYSTLVVADAQGMINCCAIPLKEPVNVTDRSWFRRIRETRSFVIDNFLISRSAHRASLPFAWPVPDDSGRLLVAVGAAFDLRHYKAVFEKISLPPDSLFILTDAQGTLLYYSPDMETGIGKSLTEMRGFGVPHEKKGRFALADRDGIKRIYWFERMSVGQPSNEICLFVGISEKAAFAGADRQMLLNIIALLIVTVISLSLAWFFGGKFFLGPIALLMQKIHNVSAGDLNVSGNVCESHGELHLLTEVFDNMVLTLSRRESERDTARGELEESRQRLALILESIADGFFTLNQRMEITYFNPAAERMLNKSKSDVLGKNLTDAFPEIKGSVFEEKFSMALREKSFLSFESYFSVSPYENWYDVRVYPCDEGISVYFRITTERKKAEEMMIQTEKMMSVGGLAAGMAHEINNPLAGILQGVQNIFRRVSHELPQNTEAAEKCGTSLDVIRLYLEQRGILNMLEGIRLSGKKAADIVDHMLRFSRKSNAEKTQVGLAEILDRTVELASHDYDMKKKYDFRNIRIIREYEPDMPEVLCCATEIEQVILNLLRNAAQSMCSQSAENSEKPLIVLRLKKDGDMARIEVEDNGPGMDEKIRKRVFEPFFTTKKAGMGTGLGLSVSYFIIASNHKGTMTVESAPDKGACFIVRIPVQEERS